MADARAHAVRAAVFPALFVVLWSTGFIAAMFGLPYAPALTFVAYRFALVAVLMTVVVLALRPAWPTPREAAHSAFAGILVHGLYLGGVFIALSHGTSAGTSAMLVGLQPLLTVLIARMWLGERVVARQWAGLLLGLAGVFLVVRHKLGFGDGATGLWPLAVAVVAISIGTLYQKRHCARVDMRSGAVIQFATCAALYLPVALLLESTPVRWTPQFLFALGWSVFVLSLGAISLLYWLLRHGAASGVARLFFLVPAATAIEAYLIFGETLDAFAVAGMALIAIGVALARPALPAGVRA